MTDEKPQGNRLEDGRECFIEQEDGTLIKAPWLEYVDASSCISCGRRAEVKTHIDPDIAELIRDGAETFIRDERAHAVASLEALGRLCPSCRREP